MTYSKEQKKEFISHIRRILVIDPDATIRGIRDSLMRRKKPLKLDKNYIGDLINKIRKERAKRLDHYTINKVLARFQDEVEELKKRLWVIITNPESSERDKISAIKELRTSSKDLFDKMFDAGVFKRKLGELELKDQLNDKERDLIKKAIALDYENDPKPKPETEAKPEPATEPRPTPESKPEPKQEQRQDDSTADRRRKHSTTTGGGDN